MTPSLFRLNTILVLASTIKGLRLSPTGFRLQLTGLYAKLKGSFIFIKGVEGPLPELSKSKGPLPELPDLLDCCDSCLPSVQLLFASAILLVYIGSILHTPSFRCNPSLLSRARSYVKIKVLSLYMITSGSSPLP
jgi:hypothetical protein